MKPGFALADHAGTFALGIAALTFAGVCAWHWTTPETLPEAAPAANAAPPAVTVASKTPPDYDEIAGWHLFGEASTESSVADNPVVDAPAGEAPENLPPSPVALQVTGTVISSTGAGARAVIMDGAGRQSENAIGDRLPGNIELHAIERTRVVIRRNGVLEAIALPQPDELVAKHEARAPTNAHPLTSTP
tara:strand:+ start:299 stop:868 length:570 start_codon:yes stop_codon:yes gene_type:complete